MNLTPTNEPDQGPPDYEDLEQQSWRQNASKVIKKLDDRDPNLLKKIEQYSWRFGFSSEKIEEEIRNNEMFANHFSIEPKRQGIHEKSAADWLENQIEIDDFKNLPKSGGNALYISSDGQVIKGSTGIVKSTKSLDFEWKTESKIIFATHKYTKESGGFQDSQFKEIKDLLEKFQKVRLLKIAYFCYC